LLIGYPDIPVIVNSEIGSQMADHVGVYADPELHHDAVRHLTEETVARGQEMTDFDIPWLSLGVSGAANLYYMLKNDTDFAAMLTCTATDTLGRTAGGFAGKYAGAGAGALLFGPAGVIVVGLLGAIGGSMIGRRVVATGRTLLVDSEETAVRVSARRVAEAAINAMPEKLEAWREKQELVAECLSGADGNRNKLQKAMTCKMKDHIEYWTAKRTELQQLVLSAEDGPIDVVERLLLLLRRAGIHPHHVQEPMRELSDKLQIFIDACKRFRLSPS
jgi:hypothetical protein